MQLRTCHFTTEDAHLVVRLDFANTTEVTAPPQITLIRHDSIAAEFFAMGTLQRRGDSWEFRVQLEPSGGRRVLEISRISNSRGEIFKLQERHVFLEPPQEGPWRGGTEALEALASVQTEREARFDATIKSDGASERDPVFSVVILLDALLLTQTCRVPGIRVSSLTNSTVGSDGVEVLNAVLHQLGFTSVIDPAGWLDEVRRRRPSAVLQVPSIQAPTAQAAYEKSSIVAQQLLHLLALKRGSSPRIIGGAIGSLGDTAGEFRLEGSWVAGADYSGNLLGGFMSGESPHSLLAHWDSVNRDPRLRLWLSLYSDALSEARWDYQLFRCFNLLEGIAKEKLPSNAAVIDLDGSEKLLDNGQPYTTKHARGAIFEIIKLVSSATHQSALNFAIHNGNTPADLWNDVGVWTQVRNAIAHRGSWSLPEGVLDDKHAYIENEISARSADGRLEAGKEQLVRSIRSAVEATIMAGLQQKI